MAENVRNALFNNAVDLADEDGYIEEVDLTVQPWNRTTVADGQWLQDHAIGPLSARDLYLADKITSANANIEILSANLAGLGIGGDGSTGASGNGGIVAGKVKSINDIIGDGVEGDANSNNMSQKWIDFVPTGKADTINPTNTLQYMMVGNGSTGVDTNTIPLMVNGRSTLLQMNRTSAANQLMVTPNGVFWRSYQDLNAVQQKNWYHESTITPFRQVMSYWPSATFNSNLSYMLKWDNTNKMFNFTAYTAPADHFVTSVDTNLFTTTEKKLGLNLTKTASNSNSLYLVGSDGYSAYTPYNFMGGLTTAANNTVTLSSPTTNGMFAFNKTDAGITPTAISIPAFDGQSIILDSTDSKYKISANAPLTATTTGVNLQYETKHFTTTQNQLALNFKTNGGFTADDTGISVKYDDFCTTGTTTAESFDVSSNKLVINSAYLLGGYSLTAQCEEGVGVFALTGTLQQILDKIVEEIHKLKDPTSHTTVTPSDKTEGT